MRTLYIIAGKHPYPGISLTDCQKQSVHLQNELIFRIALADNCTGLFVDYQDERIAQKYNSILEKLVRTMEPQRDDFLRALEREEESLGGIGSETLLLRQLAALYHYGVPVTFLPTEDHFDYMAFLQDKIPQYIWKALNVRQQRMSEDDFSAYLYEFPQIEELLGAERGRRIFAHVQQYAHAKNILHVGIAHQLREFQQQPHDFKVYRVDVIDSEEQMSIAGTLPKHLWETIESICQISYLNPDLHMRIQYTDSSYPLTTA